MVAVLSMMAESGLGIRGDAATDPHVLTSVKGVRASEPHHAGQICHVALPRLVR